MHIICKALISSSTERKVPQLKYKMRKRNTEAQSDIKLSKVPGVEIPQLRRKNAQQVEPDDDKVIENKTRRQGEELHTPHTVQIKEETQESGETSS